MPRMEPLRHISLAQNDDEVEDVEDLAFEFGEVEEQPPRRPRGRWVAALAAAAGLGYAASSWRGGARPGVLGDAAEASQLYAPSTAPEFMSQAVVTAAQAASATPPPAASPARTDCSADEEMHMGLCYDKCSVLTGGAFPFRQSAWTCCERQECTGNPFELFKCCRHNMGWCSGFDIAGMKEGNKICPHKPGACGKDEELFLGVCYRTCSSMAPEYPFRVGPASCCKTNSVRCMIEKGVSDGLAGESLTDPAFDVGADCAAAESPCKPHPPMTSFLG